MKTGTIEESIKNVLRSADKELTAAEITSKIIERNLYNFSSKQPKSIVEHAIRRSCVGVHMKLSKDEKLKSFKLVGNGKYKLNQYY